VKSYLEQGHKAWLESNGNQMTDKVGFLLPVVICVLCVTYTFFYTSFSGTQRG